jgi:hypothetical protein
MEIEIIQDFCDEILIVNGKNLGDTSNMTLQAVFQLLNDKGYINYKITYKEPEEECEEKPKTIQELRKKVAIKTAPNHSLLALYRRND